MMIKADNITYVVSEKEILKRIYCDWPGPGCYSILGPNGAGKTTLLKVMAGIISASKGEVFWQGKKVDTYSVKEQAKFRSYLPQQNAYSGELSVWELMSFSRYPYSSFFGDMSEQEQEQGEFLLSSLLSKSFKNRKLKHLSGGELQKIYLISCLFQGGKVLLLDEPLSSFDPNFQEEICFFLKKYAKDHEVQIIMVSHNLNLALPWSEKILFLSSGENLFTGTPKDLIQSGLIQRFYKNGLMEIRQDGRTFFLPRVRWTL